MGLSALARPAAMLTAGTASARTTGAALPQVRHSATFSSPSGNIGCAVYDSRAVGREARCDIAQHSWQAPPKPKSCPVDWGNGLAVGRTGKGHFLCAGDTTLGASKVLGYGEHIRVGRFRCASKTSGMTCVNVRNGHGFSLSRETVRRF